MNGYSIKEISDKLGISKDTLRYYDKINLVSPDRLENQYRYYTEDHFMDLMYVQVMKYTGFSLSEIKRIIYNKNNLALTPECLSETINILETKKNQTIMKIDALSKIIDLIVISVDVLNNKKTNNPIDVNNLIHNIYENLKLSEAREVI